VTSGLRRENRDRLFEALKKAQAARDGVVVPDDEGVSRTQVRHDRRHDRRQAGFIAALVAAAAACAAIAWGFPPD